MSAPEATPLAAASESPGSPLPVPSVAATPFVGGATVGTPIVESAQPIPADMSAPADLNKPPTTAKKTASGLVTNVVTPGTGTVHPGHGDKVYVHYSGWTKDGKLFDSSIPRRTPASFIVSDVIKGWTEGLQLMVTGERRRMWIPAKLAYGVHPKAGAPPGDLVLDLELLEITRIPSTSKGLGQ